MDIINSVLKAYVFNFSYCQKIALLKLPKVSIERKNKDKRNRIIQEPEKPGSESFRKHREEFTR